MERTIRLCCSAVFRIAAVLGIVRTEIAGLALAIGCIGGIPLLILAYKKIFNKYRVRK